MSTNKVGMTEPKDTSANLADVLMKMLAVGVAGSAILLAAAICSGPASYSNFFPISNA